MSASGGGSVGGKPDDPFERYYQIKYLEETREQNKRDDEALSPQKNLLSAYILFLLQKIIDLILPFRKQELSKSAREETKKNVKKILESLKILMKEDMSQEGPFLKKLSQCWQTMLEDSLQFKKTSPLALEFKNFIKEIASYPEHEEHTLAYYCSEYAGEGWLPFPYMELIQNLHALHKKNPSNNPLKKWTLTLEKIIKLLDA